MPDYIVEASLMNHAQDFSVRAPDPERASEAVERYLAASKQEGVVFTVRPTLPFLKYLDNGNVTLLTLDGERNLNDFFASGDDG